MKEWSDEELDGLFRKSFEEFDPAFEPNDWNNLRNRLDTAENVPVVGGWKRNIWPLALLLLIMIGGISVYYGAREGNVGEKRDAILSVPVERPSDQSVQKQRRVGPESPEKIAGSIPGTTSRAIADPENAGAKMQANRLLDNKQPIDSEETRELPQSLASASGVRKQPNLTDSERGEGAILFSKKESNNKNDSVRLVESTLVEAPVRYAANLPLGNEPVLTQTVLPQNGITAEEEVGNFLPDSAEVFQPVRLPSIELLTPQNFISTADSFQVPLLANPIASESTAGPELPAAVKTPAWTIRIGVAPDLSTVNMSMRGFDRPGPSAALLVERALSRRWFLQAGIVRSLKTYSAQAGEYEWPSGPGWYQSQMPTSVDGACRVFEVPVNVRFDFIQREQNRWFVGTGVSSYKMQNEKYTYHYKTYDPNIRWWNWEGKTGWYLFSHLNASVGYERRVSKRLSIVVEPHVRVPLRKVGFGKVNLFTTGIWVAFRYTPVFQK